MHGQRRQLSSHSEKLGDIKGMAEYLAVRDVTLENGDANDLG